MHNLLQKPLLIILLFITSSSVHAQTTPVQLAGGDSLKQLLTYFYENATADSLKQDVSKILTSYKQDAINDTMGARLLKAEDLLKKETRLDQKKVFSYTVSIEQIMLRLYPGKDHLDYATSLYNLAALYQEKGQYDKALELCQQVLGIQKKLLGEEHADYASTLCLMASIYDVKAMCDKGLALALQALAIRKKIYGMEHPKFAHVLSLLGKLYATMGQYKNAVPFYQQALAIRKKAFGVEDDLYASSADGLTVVYIRMGEYEKALPLGLEVVTIRKKNFGEENNKYAESLGNLGALYTQIGDYDKALLLYKQVVAIKKKVLGVEHPRYAVILANLASLYIQMGQYHNAMPLNQEVVALTKKLLGEEHPLYSAVLQNLALLYNKLGEYDKALPLYLQSLSIMQRTLGKEHPDYILESINTATLYRSLGDYQKALSLMEEAMAIQKKSPDLNNALYIMSLNVMTDIFLEMADYQKVLLYTQQTLDVIKKTHTEGQREHSNILNNMADAYEHLGQYDLAISLYQQALAIRKKLLGDKHPDYIYSLNSVGLHYVLSGNIYRAPAIFINANNIELEYLTRTYSTLTEQEKIELLNRESYNFYYLPSLMVTQGIMQLSAVQHLYANELALKGMVLENQKQVLHDIRQSKDTSDLLLYQQWRFNKNWIGRQYLLPLNERTATLDSLEDVFNHLEQQLSRRFAAFNNTLQHNNITVKDISRKLEKGQAAIEFIRFKTYQKKWTDSIMYAALVVLPGDTNIRFVPLFEEKQLQHLLEPSAAKLNTYAAIRKLYPGTSKPEVQSGAATDSLYMLIWKPLEKYLAGIHTVYYAPAGLLHRIPFQALRPDATHLLIDKYTLNGLLSTRSVALPVHITQKPTSAGLWGSITYGAQTGTNNNIVSRGIATMQQVTDSTLSSFNFYTSDTKASRGGEWNALPGTRKEMSNIRSVLQHAGIQTTIDSGKVATEAAFKALDGISPKVLHLATHGFFLPFTDNKIKNNNRPDPDDNTFTAQQNPMFRSGLVLAGGNDTWKGKTTTTAGMEDGILTAYEIAQMDLSNTDLVVLSACETALGDLQGNEGVIGLQRAFKMAGVKQMIVSLWRIPDKETTELMTLFYNNWLHGQPARESLRTAQMKMKQKYPPYYWAAFVLVE